MGGIVRNYGKIVEAVKGVVRSTRHRGLSCHARPHRDRLDRTLLRVRLKRWWWLKVDLYSHKWHCRTPPTLISHLLCFSSYEGEGKDSFAGVMVGP